MTHEKEIIICSAILMPDGHFIIGHRHHNCIATVRDIPRYKIYRDRKAKGIQGFVTSKHRFVTRHEAKKLAIDAGQLIKTTSSDQLFSEDLY